MTVIIQQKKMFLVDLNSRKYLKIHYEHSNKFHKEEEVAPAKPGTT